MPPQTPRKRRLPNSLLIDMVNTIELAGGKGSFQKIPSQLTDPGAMQRRADEGLAYLICPCGFNNVEKIVHRKDMMSELFLF